MIEPINPDFPLLDSDLSGVKDNYQSDREFSRVLRDKLQEVNQLNQEADQLSEDFALGKTDNIHKVTIATEKARVALNLTLAIQNKVVDSYKELMRIQV